MPIDLTGIQNENEFYSDHYLTTVFEGDIKETIERWNEKKEEGGKAPHQEFGALATPYSRAATEYKEARDTEERVRYFGSFRTILWPRSATNANCNSRSMLMAPGSRP